MSRELAFHYHLKLELDKPVSEHYFTLRCIPRSDARQQIAEFQRFIFPADFISSGTDQWDNTLLYGVCRKPHTLLEVNVCGQAVVGLADCIPSSHPARDAMLRYATPLTAADAPLREFAAQLRSDGLRPLEQAERVMEAVHERLEYRSGSTTVHTTAAQAFAQGCGVCQDFTHVMLAILRVQGIPARYVAGMLMGEGASHAWAEVLDGGNWYALDPTAGKLVTDQHIKLSHGRDHQDCTIDRGLFRGSSGQRTEISVIVTEQ